MKRTKMFLTAIAAVLAVSVMMIAPALAAPGCPFSGTSAIESAAPAAGSTCPAGGLLQQFLGNGNGGCTDGNCTTGDCTTGDCAANGCAANGCANGDCATGACPADGLMRQLLIQYMSGACADGSCIGGLDCLLTGTCGN